jgi:hypothetical protein
VLNQREGERGNKGEYRIQITKLGRKYQHDLMYARTILVSPVYKLCVLGWGKCRCSHSGVNVKGNSRWMDWPLPSSIFLKFVFLGVGKPCEGLNLNLHRSLTMGLTTNLQWSSYMPPPTILYNVHCKWKAGENQYKCLAPIYVFPEMKLCSLVIFKTEY